MWMLFLGCGAHAAPEEGECAPVRCAPQARLRFSNDLLSSGFPLIISRNEYRCVVYTEEDLSTRPVGNSGKEKPATGLSFAV